MPSVCDAGRHFFWTVSHLMLSQSALVRQPMPAGHFGADVVVPPQSTPVSSPFCTVSVDVGDFNHDSKLDLALDNEATADITLLFGAGNGSFGNPFKIGLPTSSTSPQMVAAGDLTAGLAKQVVDGVLAGEGSPDEVVASRGLKVVKDSAAG